MSNQENFIFSKSLFSVAGYDTCLHPCINKGLCKAAGSTIRVTTLLMIDGHRMKAKTYVPP